MNSLSCCSCFGSSPWHSPAPRIAPSVVLPTLNKFNIVECIPTRYQRTPGSEECITIGEREISKKLLTHYGIKLVSGTSGDLVGQGAYGKVVEFFPHRQEELRGSEDTGEWVFKPDQAMNEEARVKYGQTGLLSTHYKISEQGWLNFPLRSALSYQMAKRLGLDEVVETHLGVVGTTLGTLMKRVQGKTAHDWLIDSGKFDDEARKQGCSENWITQIKTETSPYKNEQFKKILMGAFVKVMEENGLNESWSRLKVQDHISGQCDREKLSNVMIVFDTFTDAPSVLKAIDNDFSFPELNDRLKLPSVYTTADMGTLNSYRSYYVAMVEDLLPGSASAFDERLQQITNIRYVSAEVSDRRPTLPKNSIAKSESESGSGGLEEHEKVDNNNLPQAEGEYFDEIVIRRKCSVM